MEPNWSKLEKEYYKNFDPYDDDLTEDNVEDILGDLQLDSYKDEAISLD